MSNSPYLSQKTLRYSPENSPAIFIRGGEPWLMGYCWRTPQCRKLGLAYTIVEDPGTWKIQRSHRGCSAWKEVRQQYPFLL
jgi:hypothetical protein